MTALYVAVAFCAGVVVGLALWEFFALPKLEARHIAEMRDLFESNRGK